MNKDNIQEITLVSEKIDNPIINDLRKQTNKLVSKKHYDWQVARLNEKGGLSLE